MIESIYIESSSKCNLACTYCYRTNHEYASKNCNMPLSLFIKIMDDCERGRERLFGQGRPNLFLHSYGEPTLNPDLGAMVGEAARRGLFGGIRLVSNLLACPPEAYDFLFANGLDGLYVSLDTLVPEHIAATRRGTDLPRLLAALEAVAARHADKLCVITVLTPTNKAALLPLADHLKALAIPIWNIQLLNTRRGCFGLSADEVSRIKADVLARCPGMIVNFEEESLMQCRQPFTTLAINAMGRLTPCCSMTNHEIIHFGNVAEADLAALCHGAAYASFRELFAKVRPPACAGCPYYDDAHRDGAAEKMGGDS